MKADTVATVYKGIHIKKIMDCQPIEKPLFHNEGRFFHGRRERRYPYYQAGQIKPHYSKRIRIAAIENGHIDRDSENSIKQRLVAALFKFRFDEQEV
ncbi:MAG: hypothetical protein HFI39_14680 [Lachnospiraceae bacterium]|nr:hypothetical protein [Lachnospiraceae bacterium]